jgi:beta-galactosidase beta subunit
VGLETGSLGIFFPEDAHMPCCRWPAGSGADERVRKIVVKVLLSLP